MDAEPSSRTWPTLARSRSVYAEAGPRHELAREYDYLAKPRDSGYRGIHLTWRYQTVREQNQPYNGVRIEMQLRSQIQHAWATAVETVGLFTQQALKSSEGAEDWLRFFALMSSEIAVTEDLPLVPGTPSSHEERRQELREIVEQLDALQRLVGYQVATLMTSEHLHESHKEDYCVLKFDWEAEEISISTFPEAMLSDAIRQYERFETEGARGEAVHSVLVRGGALEALKRGLPQLLR